MDDRAPVTRGELEALKTRVETLEKLRVQVEDLRKEVLSIDEGIGRHIEKAIAAAIAPYLDRLERLPHLEEIVQKAHAILQEQEIRAKVTAERRADAEIEHARVEAKRKYNVLLLKIFVPIILAAIATVGGVVGSHYGAVQEPKKELHP